LGLAVVALTTLALRVAWVAPRLATRTRGLLPSPGSMPARAGAAVAGLIGLVIDVTLVVVGLTGDPAAGANLTPWAVFFVFWLGVTMASVFIGEAATWWCPWLGAARFADLVRARRGHEPGTGHDRAGSDAADARRGPHLPWLAPLALWSLPALFLATDGGNGPRQIGWWLLAHGVLFTAGGVAWGADWLRDHEPLLATSRAIGSLSPFGRDPAGRFGVRRPLDDGGGGVPAPVVLGVAAVLAGTAVFSRVQISRWWGQHAINQSLRVRDIAHLGGLAWFVGLIAAIWAAVSNAVYQSPPDGSPAASWSRRGVDDAPAFRLAWAALPVAVTLVTVRLLEQFVVQVQNVIILASDPFSKGWNLFGTYDWTFYPRPFSPTGRSTTQLALILIGFVASAVVAHDRMVADLGPVTARRRQPLVAAVLAAGCVASCIALLGP
jgi:hypothetical protein